jgi:sialic acid synthase SpsE
MRIIAEISSNHNGSLLRAVKLIQAAAEAGCQAVKFQQFSVLRLFRPEALEKRPELLEREKLEMPLEWHEQLSECAHEHGLKYGVTPFYPGCIQHLSRYVDFFKVSSYQVLDKHLLPWICQDGKPVIMSTGMATLDEVRKAVRLMQTFDQRDITLLHCVSSYPAPTTECNLACIGTMRKEFNLPVGWSDHTCSPTVVRSAIWRWDAAAIELHFDLDDGRGTETAHSWTANRVKGLRGWMHDFPSGDLAQFDGHGSKIPARCELEERKWRSDPSDGLRPMLGVI